MSQAKSTLSNAPSSAPSVADIALRQAQHARAIQSRALIHIAGDEHTYVPIEQLRAISDIVREQAAIEWERMKYLEAQQQAPVLPASPAEAPTKGEIARARREWTRRHAA